jgi:hypothetical protein
MNNYFNKFENINKSIEQLLTDEHYSLEISRSAANLKESVRPCIEELRQSAIRLNQLIVVCSDQLYCAENVWLSKPKITEATQQKLWEEIAEISGRASRIEIIGNKCKSEALKQAKESWNGKIECLIKKWFINNQTHTRKSLSWVEKERFILELKIVVKLQIQEVYSIVPENIKLIYKEWQAIPLELIKHYISLLDTQLRTGLNNQFDLITSNIESMFGNQLNLSLYDQLFNLVISLSGQNLFVLEQEQVIKFKEQVDSIIENKINAVFKERVELVTEALEQAIAFYNDFLERQERYQQETPEQREAEKAWIDRQRQQLEQVQRGIEAILNAN